MYNRVDSLSIFCKAQDIKPGVDITEHVTLEGLKPMYPGTRFVLSAYRVGLLIVEVYAKPDEDGEEQRIDEFGFNVDVEQLRLPKITVDLNDLVALLKMYPCDPDESHTAARILAYLARATGGADAHWLPGGHL